MRLSLRPTDTPFYDLFSEQATHLVVGAGLLAEMLTDDGDRETTAKRMREAERDCDETTHRIIRRVNSTFVTPFDREDIYRLAGGMDDVMDFMEEAVDRVLLYGVPALPAETTTQVEVLRRAADLTAQVMPRLRSMTNLEDYWTEIDRLENTGDRSYRRIQADLFRGGYAALEVLKLKDVVDSLEAAIDAFESVANIVEHIAVKES
jgi:predicted phosphate transport protein (TIGR00153 family)